MSFDIIVLNCDPSCDDLIEVTSTAPIGDKARVLKTLDMEFPNISNGVYIRDESFSVEANISDDPVESIHLSLRFGKDYTEKSTIEFEELLGKACKSLGCIAFAISDNTRIT